MLRRARSILWSATAVLIRRKTDRFLKDRLMQADALTFLQRDRERYGLIYVDPPTFSNSKRADDFDVQRDHVKLLLACADRLAPEGVIVFSNNFRRFRLDRVALDERFGIEDWSAPSIPFDFTRRSDIHGCWVLRLRAQESPWGGTVNHVQNQRKR